MSVLIDLSESLLLLLDRKALPIGTERKWKVGKVVKTARGWKLIKPIVRNTRNKTKPKKRKKKPEPKPEISAPPPKRSRSAGSKNVSADLSAQAALNAIDKEKTSPLATKYHPNFSLGAFENDPDFPEMKLAFETKISKDFGKPMTLEEISHGFAVPDGFTAELSDLSSREVSWKIKDKATGKQAATLGRWFKSDFPGQANPNPIVKHDHLYVEPEFQNAGISDTINGNAFRHYEKWGVDRVKVDCASVGRYAWARLGFNFDDPTDILSDFESYIDSKSELAPRKKELMPVARKLSKEPWKFAKWDVGIKLKDEYNINSKEPLPIGKAFLLSQKCVLWSGTMKVDRKNPGYLAAISKSSVVPRST